MSVRFHHFNAYGEIPEDELVSALTALEMALPRILARLSVDRVDVIVGYSDPFWVIPAWGVGGWSHGKGRISITLAPDHPRFHDPERRERLSALLAHELHHVMRSRTVGYGTTLGEALVSEGLAQCFEIEIGCPPPPYAVALKAEALSQFAVRAREQLIASSYNHGAWFFGIRGNADFPKDGGYSLGYALVKAWLAAEGKSASATVGIPAEQILGAWKTGRLEL